MVNKIKKIKFLHLFWPLFYLLIFILLIKGGFSYLDPDLGWHLQVGKEISIEKEIPQENLYNFTYTGNWVDHEWLSDLIVYNIYNTLGYEALVVSFAALILLVLVLLNIFIYKVSERKVPFFIIAGLQLFGTIASMPHFGVRIQELALLFVLILLMIFENYNKSKNWYSLLFLPPLFFLWANLHASFLLGLVLLLSWLGIKLFEKLSIYKKGWFFWIDYNNKISNKKIIILSIFSVFSLVATFLTPYYLKLYDFLGGYKEKAYLSLIQEWLPQYAFPFHYDQLIYLALGASALLVYIYQVVQGRKKLDIWPTFLTLVFLFLSFQSRRHFPLFFVVSFFFMANFFADFFKDIKKLAYEKYLKLLTIICLLLVISVQLLSVDLKKNPFGEFCHLYPCGAVEFLEENSEHLEGNMFNYYTWGGYLIWTMPDKKIFIDGRLPQVEFADKTFIEEYYSFFVEDTNRAKKLDKYKIDTVIINAKDQDVKAKKWEKILFSIKEEDLEVNNHLREYLKSSQEWEIIYKDDTAIIFKKKN